MLNNFLCVILGFLVSFLALKRGLNKEGAGNCKMCKSCKFKKFHDDIDVQKFLDYQIKEGSVNNEIQG